jgi:hypothetical protein
MAISDEPIYPSNPPSVDWENQNPMPERVVIEEENQSPHDSFAPSDDEYDTSHVAVLGSD